MAPTAAVGLLTAKPDCSLSLHPVSRAHAMQHPAMMHPQHMYAPITMMPITYAHHPEMAYAPAPAPMPFAMPMPLMPPAPSQPMMAMGSQRPFALEWPPC